MKILIIGGMGLIGSAITEASCKKEHEVYVLSRRKLSKPFIEFGAKGIQGDWKNDEFVLGLLQERFDVIVDTLIFNPIELRRDMGLVDNKCTQFIYISTDAVYNHPGKRVNEETNIELDCLNWDYGRLKREAELDLIENGGKYSFNWTVVRPTMTYGDKRVPVGFGSRKNEWTFIERIQKGKPVIDFDIGREHAMCHSTTLGNAVTELYLNDKAYGEFFHISDDKAIRYENVFKVIGDYFETTPIVLKSDTDILKFLSSAKFTEMVFDKNPEFTLDNSKIKSIAPNVNFSVDFDASIESEISFLRDNCSSLQEDTDYNILTDAILLSYKKMNLSEMQKKQVEDYISSLSADYISTLNKFRMKQRIKSMIRPVYKRVLNFKK